MLKMYNEVPDDGLETEESSFNGDGEHIEPCEAGKSTCGNGDTVDKYIELSIEKIDESSAATTPKSNKKWSKDNTANAPHATFSCVVTKRKNRFSEFHCVAE